MVFDESESQGWCTECAYFLANSEPRGAYSAGAYKKSVYCFREPPAYRGKLPENDETWHDSKVT